MKVSDLGPAIIVCSASLNKMLSCTPVFDVVLCVFTGFNVYVAV